MCPLCEAGYPRDGKKWSHSVNDRLLIACALPRPRRKLRKHLDTWLRREQHLFEPNEVRLRDSEVPR